jgi:potassium efflux system protein
MKSQSRSIPIVPVLLFATLFSRVAFSQGIIAPARQPADTAAVQILPFPSSAISEAFSETFDAVSKAANERPAEEGIQRFKVEVDTLFVTIDQFLSDTTLRAFTGVGVRELDNISAEAQIYRENINQLQGRLVKTAGDAERNVGMLLQYKKRWELTLETSGKDELPASRLDRINRTIQQTDSVRVLLLGDLDGILLLQDRLSEKGNLLDALQIRIRDQRTILGERLFSRDMPPLLKDLFSLKDTTLIRRHLGQFSKTVRSDAEIFKSKFLVPMLFISFLFLGFMVFAVWYKTHFAKLMSVERFELSDMHMTVIYSPVVVVFFIAALMIRFIFPELPHTFRSINLIILMVPMVIIVIRLFGSLARTWMTALVITLIFTFIYELIYYPDILMRLILLILSILGLGLFLWMIIRKPLLNRFNNTLLYQAFRLILALFTAMLAVAVAGNLLGAFRMAEYFTLIPIQVALLSIGILVATKVADTIVFLVLASNNFQRLNIFREEFDVIYTKTVRLINLFLWIFLFVTALNIFRVKDEFFDWGNRVLTEGWKIGAVDITPRSILVFVLVIWLSIVITRMVRHILEKDVFTRVTVSKGMPHTIILLVRIALITGGFFLAAAAAGMELTNLSIVLGAFSVGIGFGLQNIFNNMVSGLILAFERPIKVGDVVQVGELMGTVLSIGLRSSTVKSFDGAEVIVPNGNLISNEMINWTKSDSNRRMDLRVGVAYGTDPEVVIGIMEAAAAEHPKVNMTHAPMAFFTGFGESSLDFRLLAWTDIDDRLPVESELNVAINRKLKEAGIEIPFPQRDLHVRSDFRETPKEQGS